MRLRNAAQEMRFALRQMRRAPGFTVSAVLTLAIGIGANTSLFSLLNGYWRPLAVPDPEQLVIVAAESAGDETGLRHRFSYPTVNDYRVQADVFSDVFAFCNQLGGMTVDNTSSQFVSHGVSGNFFTALRLKPAVGRLFEPGEGEHPGAEPLVVLGHAYWQKRFSADPSVVGRLVRIDGRAARIIGVAPAGFHGLVQGVEMEGYVPLGALSGREWRTGRLFTDRAMRPLMMAARMKPGVTLEAAQTAVETIARRLQTAYPAAERGRTARVIPEPLARPIPLRALTRLRPLIQRSALGLAGLVLLIACMNVANLLLVRAGARQREIAVRAALGCGRGRLLRLLLAESLLVAFAGTLAGLVFARWSRDLFLGTIDVALSLPLNLDFHFDWRVFAYAAGIALATGVLMGIVPAMRASRVRVTALLHNGGYGSSSGAARLRLRSALVVAQVAGSLILLIVAGLFVRSLRHAQFTDLGFEPANILNARLDPRQIGYSPERTEQFYDELERRLRALPGVESVAFAVMVPLGLFLDASAVLPEGRTFGPDEPEPFVGTNSVTPSYFDTLRMPVLKGRKFDDRDTRSSTPVVIVNETMARLLWPAQDPLDKRVSIAWTSQPWWQVVGVARDSKYIAIFEPPMSHLYFPLKQTPSFMRVAHLRSHAAPDVMGPLLQREVHALAPDLPVADVKTMEQAMQGGVGYMLFRVGAIQAGAMGLLGLILAVIGVYGVVSYSASQRTREMGIRVALGADPSDVRRLILGQGAMLVGTGVAIGLLAAAAVTRMLGKFFVLVGATDAVTFASVTLLLCAAALVACYLPARRAMRADPMIALRHE